MTFVDYNIGRSEGRDISNFIGNIIDLMLHAFVIFLGATDRRLGQFA